MSNKLLVLLMWLLLGLPAVLVIGCENAPTLPPEPEKEWPPRQKPIYNYGVA